MYIHKPMSEYAEGTYHSCVCVVFVCAFGFKHLANGFRLI